MDEEYGCLWILLVVVGVIVWFVWFGDSEFRYKLQYDNATVSYREKPHDCEFLTAPMGKKNCSYKKIVTIMLFSRDTNTGKPIVSYDNGATWQTNPDGPTAGKHIYVHWVKDTD